jgi:hypothetical protein
MGPFRPRSCALLRLSEVLPILSFIHSGSENGESEELGQLHTDLYLLFDLMA